MDHEQHVAHLAREAEAFAAGLAAAPPDAPVAACPGWTVRDLAEHLGTVHRWAALALRTTPDATAPSYDGSPEADGMTLLEWYDAGREALVADLRAAGPTAPCWTMAAPHTAAFWSRRQALETAVHRWDVEAAAGAVPAPIDPDLALDGVGEVLDTMLPRQVRLGRIPVTRDWVRLVVAGHELALATSPDDREPDPVATVDGTAEDVLLLLWGRRTPGDLTTTGDPATLAEFLSRPHVP